MAHAGGRPKIELDYDKIEKLATIQCTQEEIANILEVSVKTLQRDEEFCRIHKKGMENGRSSLRRLQWKGAQEGNTTMLIWLGKQYLGQSEKVVNIDVDKNREEAVELLQNIKTMCKTSSKVEEKKKE